MPPVSIPVSTYLLVSLVAGVVGAIAMYIVMRLLNVRNWAHGDMVAAVGSMITKRRENSFAVGALVHLVVGVVFAFLYLLGFARIGFIHFPAAPIAGLFIGALHGSAVAIALVWVVSDQHPLQEFQRASLAVGVLHCIGHCVFGLVVGLVIASWPI
ncbi:hypothetical protein K0B96_13325 [Horticoccus luteus]|uniref:Uncharacterized protein n=1 Tax=Horticoccus luteus TaxID=2862869 RepID=A0A8F9TUC1_9BACT|nr:hypothetical protein [Horticoccus luteus]QYM78275.1 hypothetical protein K0B96_13325 [Horticoccus luteus]